MGYLFEDTFSDHDVPKKLIVSKFVNDVFIAIIKSGLYAQVAFINFWIK